MQGTAPNVTTAPPVRAGVALITGGRRGTDEDTLAACGAILIDAALAGVVDVTGRRTLGVDRRRVIPGPVAPDPAADPLLADVRRRVEAARPASPATWLERVAVFGEDAVAGELVAAGLAERVDVAFWKRAFRHRTLAVADEAAAEVRARLEALAAGRSASLADASLALVLRETDLLTDLVGRRETRRIGKRLRDADAALPPAARAVVATLRERRRRAESIGTYYADD